MRKSENMTIKMKLEEVMRYGVKLLWSCGCKIMHDAVTVVLLNDVRNFQENMS